MPRLLRCIPTFLASCLLFGVLAGGAFSKDIDPNAPLPADPAIVRRVTLDNGFSYWIRPHRIPGQAVELGLHVRAGSLDERDDERGLAHFLEHMAFNGSTHFPPGEVVRFFESIGLTFGQHQNANTSYDRTKYFLSLPTNDPAVLEKALTFFADIAYGLSLSKEELDAERAVILEEERARAGVQERMLKRNLEALAPGALITNRAPIGIPAVIRGAPQETFRRFYERCYRPERTTLLVCGDVGPEVIEPMIRKLFSAWKGKGESAAQPGSGLKPLAEMRVTLDTDPDQDGAMIMFLRPTQEPPERTFGDLRASLVSIMGVVITQMRWARLAEQGGPFEGLGVSTEEMAGADSLALAVIAGEPAAWQSLVEILVRELRRIQEHGFEDDELAFAQQILKSQIGRMVEVSRTWSANKQLEEMFDALHSGSTPVPMEPARGWLDDLMPGIGKAEVEAAFRAQYTLDGALIAGRMPAGLPDAPTPEAFAAHVRHAIAAELARTAEVTAEPADLGAVPALGKLVKGTFDAGWGVHTWVYANGATVRFRPMETPNYALVRVVLAGGYLDEGAAERGRTEAAVLALDSSTMASRTNSATRLRRHLLGIKVDMNTSLDADRVQIDVAGPPHALEAGLQLLHHVLTGPKVEGPALARWKQSSKRGLEQARRDAETLAVWRAQALATEDDPRLLPPGEALIAALTPEVAQARAEALAQGSGLEVAIVGEIPLADALRLATAWIGSLPARPVVDGSLEALRATKQAKLPRRETVRVDSTTDRAAVRLQWRGVGRHDAADRATLMHAAMILMTRLQADLREKRGLTYTAAATYETLEFEGADALVVMFTADPAKAEGAAKVARELTEALRDTGPTPDEVTATAAQMQHLLQQANSSPAFWAMVLSRIATQGSTLEEVKAEFVEWTKVDGARIQAALAKIVREDRYVEVLALPRR